MASAATSASTETKTSDSTETKPDEQQKKIPDFSIPVRVSIKISVYETTHKKYYERVASTVMQKSSKETFQKNAGSFQEAHSRSSASSSSSSSSGSVSGSGAGIEASASFSEDSSQSTSEAIANSVSKTWEDAQSLSTSQETSTSQERENSLEFQDGTTQIYALITTTITIDGQSAIHKEERYLTAGLTAHITEGAVGERLESWEKKAWRDFFHHDKIPDQSLYFYTMYLPAKTDFRLTLHATTRDETLHDLNGKDSPFHQMIWAPGEFVYIVYSTALFEVHKENGYYRPVGTPWHSLEAGTCRNGKLYLAGSKTADDERKIYVVDPSKKVSEPVEIAKSLGGEVLHMQTFNDKIYYLDKDSGTHSVYAINPKVKDVKISLIKDKIPVNDAYNKGQLAATPDSMYIVTGGVFMKMNKLGHVFTIRKDSVGPHSLVYYDGGLYGTGGSQNIDLVQKDYWNFYQIDSANNFLGDVRNGFARFHGWGDAVKVKPADMCAGPDGIFGVTWPNRFLCHYRRVFS